MRHSSSKPCVTCPIWVLCLHLRVPRWSLINESLKFEHAFRLSSHRQAIIVKLRAASLDCTEMIQNLAVVCCCPLGTTSGEKKLKLCGCGCAEGPNLSHDHKIAQPSKRWEKDRKSDLPSLPPQTFTTIYKLSAKKGNWKSRVQRNWWSDPWKCVSPKVHLRDLRNVRGHSCGFLQSDFSNNKESAVGWVTPSNFNVSKPRADLPPWRTRWNQVAKCKYIHIYIYVLQKYTKVTN